MSQDNSEPTAVESPDGNKPKPKRKRTKKVKAKRDVSAPPEPAEATAAPDAQPAAEAPPAPEADGNTNGSGNAPDGEGKPKRRRRSRRRRKKVGGGGQDGSEQDGPAAQNNQSGPVPLEVVTGIFEQGPKSDGRLRQLEDTFLSYPTDPVIPGHLVDKYGLRPGVQIECTLGKPFGGGQQPQQRSKKKKKVKYFTIDPQARRVDDILQVEGMDPNEYPKQRKFEDLTSVMPEPRLTLEYPDCPPACRLIDMFCPIGYGTRGMIVSPPKAGKTTLLQNIAFSIRKNHPEVEVIALLIDERPEEVTDFRRNVPCKVWASSNDHTPERHCGLAIAAIEHCKRQAELGKDVVVLLDSLTRLGRAFNTAPGMANTGRTLSGGLDAGALAVPKQLFGAARRFEEGGTLTIVATALVDTGSRGDQVIFEEFKGTGNMELILDRKIAEQRLFPAIDLAASGTRNEDKLITNPEELETVNALRRRLLNMNPVQQIDQLLRALKRFETNAELVGNPQSPGNAQAGPRMQGR